MLPSLFLRGVPLALLSSCDGCPSRSPAEGSEREREHEPAHAHAGKILRDHRDP